MLTAMTAIIITIVAALASYLKPTNLVWGLQLEHFQIQVQISQSATALTSSHYGKKY